MAPPSKRQRENTAIDVKGGRVSDAPSPQLLELINQRFAEQAELISTSIRSAEERILGQLNGRIGEVAGDVERLSLRVQQLEAQLEAIPDLQAKLNDLQAKLQLKEEAGAALGIEAKLMTKVEAKLAAQATEGIAADLRIHGVPYTESENLRTLYNALCFSLNLSPPPKIKDIYRVKQRRSSGSTVDPVIIVKLENVREKIIILRQIGAYRREHKQQLSLQLIGFESHVPFYVNEQLTKAHYEIFKAAIKLKKQKLLTAVFIRRSLVHVREAGSDNIFCINEIGELSALCSDNALQQQNVTATEESERSFRN
ncbi:hypothetical protein ACLKA6_002984 [Drosophila palustris]